MGYFQINPSSIQFTHKIGDTLPPAFLISHDLGAGYDIVPETLPVWLTIYDVTSSNFKVKLSTQVDQEQAGTKNETITLLGINNSDPNGPRLESMLFVELNLIYTQLLEVTPSSANFSFVIGGSQPSSKHFSVKSESNWTVAKTQSWLNLSATSGSNNGSFSASVTTAGLSPGTYNDTITVDDGGTPKLISISLTVSDPDTGSDYLNIYPINLNFGFTEGGTVPNPLTVDINASAGYSVSTAQAWISISSSSGVSGVSTIDIGMQNLGSLAVGDHVGYVDFTLGTIVKRVTVNLTIFELVSESLTPGQLYFCDDENYIRVSSGRQDTNLLMNINASFEGKSFAVPYDIPFFEGVASKRIGPSAHNIIGQRNIFGLADISIFSPYSPVNLNIDINEIETDTDAVLQTISLSGIKFVKGMKPSTNWLSNLPREIFLSKSGTLIFSVLSGGAAAGNLVLSGDVDLTIQGPVQAMEFYTVVIPLAAIQGIKVGDVLVATILGESITVNVIEDNMYHTMIFAETPWATFESFECRGAFIETSNYKDAAYAFRKNHMQVETKVYERKNLRTYQVNTGLMYSQEMKQYLSKILESPNMYLKTDGLFEKVRCTTKKREVLNVLEESRDATLTFENVLQ